MWSRRFRVAAACLLLSAVPGSAWAFPAARLVYVRGQGAERCPAEIELRLAVAHRLGYDPFHTGARRTIIAVVGREGTRFGARFELVDERGHAQGERRLEATSERCDDIVRALALSMSIAIDPERQREAEPLPASPWPAAEQKSPLVPPASISRASEGRGPETRRLDLRVGLGGRVALGAGPSPAAGALLVLSPRFREASLGLELAVDAKTSRAVAAGTRIESSLLTGSVAPCWHYDPAYLCALGSFGRVVASSDAAQAGRDAAFFGAGGGRVGSEWAVGPAFRLRTHAELLAIATRHRIELDGRTVWQMPALYGALGVVLLARLP